MNFIRTHKAELFLFAFSLAIHSVLFTMVVHRQGSVVDTVRVDDGYYELAQNVIAGHGFSWSAEPPYAPNPLRTPGYVYVLAGLIALAGVAGAAVIQLIAASFIPILGLYIAKRITGSKHIGLITGIVLALDPTLAFLSFEFYTDTLFILLFFGWLILTFRYAENRDLKTLAGSALVLGLSVLVRPIVQFVPVFIALCILWQFGKTGLRKSALHIAVYFLIVGAVLAPWIIRNEEAFGAFGLSSQSSFILYTNLAPAVLSVADGTEFTRERDSFLTPAEYKGDAITLANGDAYTGKAIAIATEHPFATAKVLSKSLFTFFTIDGFYTGLFRLGYEPGNFLAFLITARLLWIGITLAAVAGALRYLFTKRTPWAVLLVALIAYFALTSSLTAFGTNPRYRLPVDPIIFSLAAFSVFYAYLHIQRLISHSKI